MDLGGAARAVFARSQLAFDAAAGLPGRFEAFDSEGMLALATTAAGLEFLNSVAQVRELSVEALPRMLTVFATMGAPMPTLSAAEDAGVGLATRLSALLYEPTASRPLAILDLTGPARDPHHVRGFTEGLTVTEVTAEQASAQVFARILAAGYEGGPAVTRFLLAEHTFPGVRRFLAWHRGEPVAAAAMTVHDRVAVLGGATTLRQARGLGAQRALIEHRVREARLAACSAAVASLARASASERNLASAGFTIWQRPTWRVVGPRAPGGP